MCCPQESLFERYDCSSRHKCHIGMDVDVSQLLRVLRAAQQSGETLELKLHQLGVPSKPFLSLICRGPTLIMQQDIPIASPLRPSGAASTLHLSAAHLARRDRCLSRGSPQLVGSRHLQARSPP